MQVTGRAAPPPGVLGPDSRGPRKSQGAGRGGGWTGDGGQGAEAGEGPDTHHIVSLIEDHNCPLQVDAVCPAAL